MAGDIVDDLRRSGEPMLADVFAVIDRRLGERLSLRDVAHEVGMTPGHLTTVVRRRTGRTVQEWIIERRMAEARILLEETDLPVAEIARRVGFLIRDTSAGCSPEHTASLRGTGAIIASHLDTRLERRGVSDEGGLPAEAGHVVAQLS